MLNVVVRLGCSDLDAGTLYIKWCSEGLEVAEKFVVVVGWWGGEHVATVSNLIEVAFELL